MLSQLPLNFQLRDDASFESFYPGQNVQVIDALKQFSEGEGERYIYLFGAEGSGRSHLLQAACRRAAELGMSSVYIPLQRPSAALDMLVGLENLTLVCIDEIETIAGQKPWEETLFHLFNQLRSNLNRLLLTGNMPANQLPIALPDLKSRLSWGLSYQLHPLSDEEKLQALQLRAFARGLILNDTVGQFLLSRCPRNMTELFLTLEHLDRASLAEQRRLTIPFVKQVLGL